jgi:hypothetical protein
VANYTRSETIRRTVEYAVPTGSAIGEFDKAWTVARNDYVTRTGVDPAMAVRDDWARVEARDDEVVIVLDFEEPPGDDRARLDRIREINADLARLCVTRAGKGPSGCLSTEDLERIADALDGPVRHA